MLAGYLKDDYFVLSMDFALEDIAGMLEEYEEDHQTGMKIPQMAEWI